MTSIETIENDLLSTIESRLTFDPNPIWEKVHKKDGSLYKTKRGDWMGDLDTRRTYFAWRMIRFYNGTDTHMPVMADYWNPDHKEEVRLFDMWVELKTKSNRGIATWYRAFHGTMPDEGRFRLATILRTAKKLDYTIPGMETA